MNRTAVLGALIACAAAAFPASAEDLRITHVTIISPERAGPLPDVDVTIHDGRIAAIGKSSRTAPGIRTIDGKGLYLTPGLIDSHVHLGGIAGMNDAQEAKYPELAKAMQAQKPLSFLLHGFTTLIDLVSTPEEMARWKAQAIVPDTYFCGGAMLMDGYPMHTVPKPDRYAMAPYMLIEPGTPPPDGIDPAQHTPAAVVARMKADGALCVKTFYEPGFGPVRNLPVPKVETIRDLVAAAHANGVPVLLHANGADAQTFGLAAGVDIMAHGIWQPFKALPDDAQIPAIDMLLDGINAKSIGWQATIQVLHGERDLFHPDFLSNPELARVVPANLLAWYRTPEGQWFHDDLAANMPKGPNEATTQELVDKVYAPYIARVTYAAHYLTAHHGRLLFGTDTPSAPTYANPPGLNGWWEIQDLAAAGVTPAQIFKAATLSNAQAFKLDPDVGTVQTGKRANLLLLRQDPAQTIEAYRSIVNIILGGRVLDRGELAANRSH